MHLHTWSQFFSGRPVLTPVISLGYRLFKKCALPKSLYQDSKSHRTEFFFFKKWQNNIFCENKRYRTVPVRTNFDSCAIYCIWGSNITWFYSHIPCLNKNLFLGQQIFKKISKKNQKNFKQISKELKKKSKNFQNIFKQKFKKCFSLLTSISGDS